MNYPLVRSNPILQKKMNKDQREAMEEGIRFDNMQAPLSGHQHAKNFLRPFSTKEGGETLMSRRKELQEEAQTRIKSVNVNAGLVKTTMEVVDEEP